MGGEKRPHLMTPSYFLAPLTSIPFSRLLGERMELKKVVLKNTSKKSITNFYSIDLAYINSQVNRNCRSTLTRLSKSD